MALKLLLATLEGLDPKLHALYTEDKDNGGFVLDVDGSEALAKFKEGQAKVREFRDSNVDQGKKLKEFEALQEQYKGVDLDKYKAGQQLLQQMDDDKERQLAEAGNWKELFSTRNAKMVAAHAADIKAKQAIIDTNGKSMKTLRRSLGTMKIEQALGTSLNKSGAKLKKSAMPDILARTHSTFSVNDDGEIQALVNGQVVRSEKTGEAITMDEHVDAMSKGATHLFEQGGGGGAGGGTGTQRSASGKIRVDRTDATAMAMHHEAIAKDQVEFYN